LNGACLHAWKRISIGRNCLIAANVTIIDANGHPLSMCNPAARLTTHDEPREVIIGDNVWIGLGAVILPGTRIGDGAVIGANSVVSGPIPERCVVRGNPARVMKTYGAGPLMEVDEARGCDLPGLSR
jgi:acetyltransferase-like isoleucine patch superfamily enzyme